MAQLLDGKIYSEEALEDIRNQVAALAERGVTPGLAVILGGEVFGPAAEPPPLRGGVGGRLAGGRLGR